MAPLPALRERRLFVAGVALICVIAAARVVSTYRVFSQTVDEPLHLAAGYQWLMTDRYDLDAEHPPLARIGFAAASRLERAGLPATGDRLQLGNELLLRDGRYLHNLAFARLGNLPWLLITIVVVAIWCSRLFGRATGLSAAALVSCLPPILAHAGLATTDMAAAATVCAALFCYSLWLREPEWRNALLLGLAVGAGLLVKFSFPVFFGVSAVTFTAAHWLDRDARARLSIRTAQAAVVALIAFVLVWGGYGFSTGRLHDVRPRLYPPGSAEKIAEEYANEPGYEWVRADLIDRYRAYGRFAERSGVRDIDFVDWARAAGFNSPLAGRHGNTLAGAPAVPSPPLRERLAEPFRRAWQSIAMNVRLPAPWFIAGFEYAMWHARGEHPAFLMGRYSDGGWWYYFPIIFFYKTPIPFLALALIGAVVLAVQSWRERGGERFAIALAPLVMFIPAVASSLNIGVRHILPVYPLLSMPAAFAVGWIWRTSRVMRPVAIVLLAWYFAGTALGHPDYIAWFNEAAGRHPEHIAVDSNLDWGQDLLRVADAKKRLGIDRLSLAYFGSADPRRLHIGTEELPPLTPVHGWIAISEMKMTFGENAKGTDYAWLRAYPMLGRIGRSIRLYHVP